ncbi:MAG TPA: hypothetical protein VF235_00130 [Actinomycetota bacterium]
MDDDVTVIPEADTDEEAVFQALYEAALADIAKGMAGLRREER